MSERIVTIRHQDTRGIATLIGFVTVLVLTRLWWTGLLADMFSAAYSPKGEGLSSATYVILSFMANLVYGIGTVIVLAWSGLWWVIMDVVQGFRQMSQERQAKQEVADAVVNQAVAEELVNEPVANPIVAALETIDANVRTTFEKVESLSTRIEEIDARVSFVEEMTEPPAPKPTTTKAKGAR